MSQRLGSNYIIDDSAIGSGATGSVYIGRDVNGNQLAFKILHPSLTSEPGVIDRFLKERTILKDLRDPRLVQVRDFVAENETLAIVMDLVDGPNLRDWIREHGPIPPSEVARIGAEIAAGLSALHSAQVIHRDIKPENVLVDSSTSPVSPKITDFGIASLVDSEHTRSTVLAGTPQYMAPELFRGEPVTSAVDMYSLGIMLYELSCGVGPFCGTNAAVMRGHLDLAPGRPEGIPPQLWGFINSLLSKEPSSRPTAFEAAHALPEMLLNGLPPAPQLLSPPLAQPIAHSSLTEHVSHAVRPELAEADSPRNKSRFLPAVIAAGAALIVLVALAGGAALLFGGDGSTPVSSAGATTERPTTAAPTSPSPSTAGSEVDQAQCLDSSLPPAPGDVPIAEDKPYGDNSFSQSNVCAILSGGYPQRSSLVYRGGRIDGPVTYWYGSTDPSEFQASFGFEAGSPASRSCTVAIYMHSYGENPELIKSVTVTPGVTEDVKLPLTGSNLTFDYGDCGQDPRRSLEPAGSVVIGTPTIRKV